MENKKETNLKLECRLCLQNISGSGCPLSFKVVLQNGGVDRTYSIALTLQQLMEHICLVEFDGEVEYEEQMPKRLCRVCKDGLLSAYTLRLTAKKSDDVLYERLQRTRIREDYSSEEDVTDEGLIEEGRADDLPQILEEVEEDANSDDERESCPESPDADLPESSPPTCPPVSETEDCPFCGESLNNVKALLSHEAYCPKMALKCGQCSSKYYRIESLMKHVQSNHNDLSTHTCTFCQLEFPTGRGLSEHLGALHKDAFRCPICKNGHSRYINLIAHMRMHTGETPLHCSYCDIGFGNFHLLTSHVLRSHLARHTSESHSVNEHCPPTPTPVSELKECQYCGDKEALPSHQAHCPKMALKCGHCSSKHYNIRLLMKHVQSSHNDLSTHTCTICQSEFPTGLALSDHLIALHKDAFHCRICKNGYNNYRGLIYHMRSHTDETPLFLCNYCGKGFNSNSLLKYHLARHTGETNYACERCPSKFFYRNEWTAHQDRHTGEQSYACETCGKTFATRAARSGHKNTHKEKQRHDCKYCGRTFNWRQALKQHIRTHTGERPYKCKHCDRAFALNNHLRYHMRSHLGERIYKCDQCPEAFKYHRELRSHIEEHFRRAKESGADPINQV